jgi:dihydrofolate reductase
MDMTKGKTIIMGRKTFESVGSKPMPNRMNLVVTRKKDLQVEGVTVFSSIDEAVSHARALAESKKWPSEIMICGGEEIYKQTLPITNRIYLTIIDKDYEGDTFYPQFDTTKFHLKEKRDRLEPVPFSFCTFER